MPAVRLCTECARLLSIKTIHPVRGKRTEEGHHVAPYARWALVVWRLALGTLLLEPAARSASEAPVSLHRASADKLPHLNSQASGPQISSAVFIPRMAIGSAHYQQDRSEATVWLRDSRKMRGVPLGRNTLFIILPSRPLSGLPSGMTASTALSRRVFGTGASKRRTSWVNASR